jgi:hypothetical protein
MSPNNRLEKQIESRERPRFTSDEIVCAIEAVEKTGLTIDGVEITLTGSINIKTRRAVEPKSQTNIDQAQPAKKQA